MKNLLLLIILFQLSFSGNTQTSYIEIAVDETVELTVKNLTLQLVVESEYRQRNDEFDYDYDDYYWEEEYYYEDEEDYYYEQMMEESPRKVSKEMKKEYEQRQADREQREIQREIDRAEREAEMEKFQPFTPSDLIKLLKENNIAFTITSQRAKDDDREYYGYEEEYYDEEEYNDNYYADTVVEILISNKEELKNVRSVVSESPVDDEFTNIVYQSIEDHYATVIPKLTEKANSQAAILAKSLGKKVGKVLQCSNVYPYTPSSRALSGMYNRWDRDEFDWFNDPFLSGKEEMIQYVYRFAMI